MVAVVGSALNTAGSRAAKYFFSSASSRVYKAMTVGLSTCAAGFCGCAAQAASISAGRETTTQRKLNISALPINKIAHTLHRRRRCHNPVAQISDMRISRLGSQTSGQASERYPARQKRAADADT